VNQTDQYRFSALLQEAARLWRQRLDRRLKHLGLSQSQWVVLLKVPATGLTQTVLADAVGVEGPTLVGLLDRLERNGWIERGVCQEDRRAKRVMLTPKAKATRAAVRKIASGLRREVLAGIDEARVEQCTAVLSEIRQRLESVDD
jgi:MarR family transcriptional regulator, transcriptional regulator for hemolysin